MPPDDFVEIYHPGLPGQPIARVAPQSVATWEAKGWLLVGDPVTTGAARIYAGPSEPAANPGLGELVWLQTDGDGHMVGIASRDEQTEEVTVWPITPVLDAGSGLYELSGSKLLGWEDDAETFPLPAGVIDASVGTTAGTLAAGDADRVSPGTRMRRAAAAASDRNSPYLGVMASPPTITTGSTVALDSSLTNSYLVATKGMSFCTPLGGIAQGRLDQMPSPVYYVAPVVSMPTGSGGNTRGDVSKTSNGFAFESVTDAPDVMIDIMGGGPGLVSIEVDNQRVSAADITTAAAGSANHSFVKLAFGSASVRGRTIRVELASNGAFAGFYVGPTYKVWKSHSETNIVAAFVGDSVVASSADPPMRCRGFAWVMGKILGWTDVRQVALGGTGFISPGASGSTFGHAMRVADVVAQAPDVLIIQASQNDDPSLVADITAAALTTFRAYRTALPSTPIVVIGAVAGSTGPSATRLGEEAAVLSAFTTWADPLSWWIPCSAAADGSWETGTGIVGATTGTGNRDRYGFDTSHPNADGCMNLGVRAAEAFKRLVLPYVP